MYKVYNENNNRRFVFSVNLRLPDSNDMNKLVSKYIPKFLCVTVINKQPKQFSDRSFPFYILSFLITNTWLSRFIGQMIM